MNNKVLVTGGTGFVGMRIISRLLEQGYEVFHRAINVCRSGFITR